MSLFTKRHMTKTPTVQSEQHSSQTFEEVTDTSDVRAARARIRRSIIITRTMGFVLLIVALCITGYPLVRQEINNRRFEEISSQTAHSVAKWPHARVQRTLQAARDYNRRLAASSQTVLGESRDPFAKTSSGQDSTSAKDKEYQSLLNTGDEIMGIIRIPEISLTLPIYHGTSTSTLSKGIGHLYGTSLPVGGKNTHAVLTGHRGLVDAMMFTRLDEMKQGDLFYIDVMNRTLGYQVDSITVIEPQDIAKLRIIPGQDRVTLMTCTPYGINTHRLLVSGHRVTIPNPPPLLYDARTLAIAVVVLGLLIGLPLVWIIERVKHKPWRVMRHANAHVSRGDARRPHAH